MALELDSLLHDRYRIREELGHGGMGAVYRALDENLGVEVALKENLFTSPEAERQFRREAVLLASLRHAHLPRVTDHFVIAEQGQYLVMDFIPGDDAKQLLERRGSPLPESDVVRWGREILDALHYLHTRQPPIIHRDIKPGNIKIMPDGRAVLVDFGLAKVHNVSQSTTVGAKALTPGFAPPEQYGLGRTDPRTDIYSLGATLYALLTNSVPEDSLEQAMGQKALTPVRQANPAISAQTAGAVERSLAIQPENRFQSAADMRADLKPPDEPPTAPPRPADPSDATYRPHAEQAEATQQAAAGAPPVPATVPVRRRGAGWLWPVVIIGLLLIVGVGGGLGLVMSGLLTFPATPTATAENTPAPTATLTPAEVVVVPPTATATPAPTDTPTATPPPTDTPLPTDTPTPAATPRGGSGQIAFVSERDGAPQVYVMNVDGSDVTRLTNIADGACQPTWSPDGERLLFVSPCRGKSDKYERGAIYSMQADGSRVQLLMSLVGGVYDADWSSAGIAFTYLQSNQPRVWTMAADGSGSKQISAARADDSHPSWAPGGDKLVFVNTSRAGRPTLYWMFADGTFNGTLPDQVTREVSARAPEWSPAGDLVAYVVDNQIWVINWDARGFGPVQLTTRGPNDDPDWSPDGRWLTFESWRDAANHDIYIMTSNGGLQTRLTDHPASDYQPAWRP